MPPFRDEQVLVCHLGKLTISATNVQQMIAPGSQTTLAQVGLPESYTPARLRILTRMFPAEQEGEWEPLKVREKRGAKPRESNGTADVSMAVVDGQDPSLADDEILYEEDPNSDEGAVYPLKDGRVVNWPCFFALLHHIHKTFDPPFHTPILLIAQPVWTAQDREILTQFFFEKFKIPAFCIMDSALAVCYAYAVPTATIIDVGYTKCDITAVRDFTPSEVGRGVALHGCGGEAMTERLLSVLERKGFNKEMCEQLKKNPICEVLPPGTEPPTEDRPSNSSQNPSSVASTGPLASGDAKRESISAQGGVPRGPGVSTESGDADRDHLNGDDDEGVLDVASIVASGKTSEFLAQKEREKAAKAAARKNAAAEAAAASKQARLPNSKRARAVFHYHERKPIEELGTNSSSAANGETNAQAAAHQDQAEKPTVNGTGQSEEAAAAARKEERREERRRNREGTAYIKKEVEVGPERFEVANEGVLDRIADSVHRCILLVPEISKRSELWESLIILGNGSKVKGMDGLEDHISTAADIVLGFKESLLATLNARYLISPSSATIFSSELPSNFTTPVATGANTPQRQPPPQPHHGPGVNPLLLAATTASNTNLAPPGQQQQLHTQLQLQQYQQQQQMMQQTHQHGHSQTPASIKLQKIPEYFPEWKEVGMEEASFLGAQVAAKVVFVVDQGLSKGYMSRTEYNDLGPQGIHESAM